MPFEIIHHKNDAIIEAIYPASPTAEDIQNYVKRAREIIDEQHGRRWCCLADQRAMMVMTPELVTTLGELNAYACAKGMVRTARLVASAVAGLQAHRIAREHGISLQAFESRDVALAWLRTSMSTPPRA